MKIVDYLQASLFKNSHAAYRLAVNHESYIGFSHQLIANKLFDVQYRLEGATLTRNKYDALLLKKVKYTSLLRSLVAMNTPMPPDALSLSSGSGRLSGYQADGDDLVSIVQRTTRVCLNADPSRQRGGQPAPRPR